LTAAVRQPEADWQRCRTLASVLMQGRTEFASTPDDVAAILEEIHQLYERALPLANYRSRRMQTEAELAECLLSQAVAATNLEAKQKFFVAAIKRIDAVSESAEIRANADKLMVFGFGLMEAAKLNGNTDYYRRAVELLRAALEVEPTNMATEYNLACLYALIGQPGDGLNHLSVCLSDKQQGSYYSTLAAKDPDLASVRALPGYARLTVGGKMRIVEDPATLRERGKKLLAEAQGVPPPTNAVENLQSALMTLQQLVTLQTGQSEPLALLAQTERELARVTGVPKQRVALVESARMHSAAARGCADTDAGAALFLGRLLREEVDLLATGGVGRRQLLEESVKQFHDGFKLAKYSGERAALHSELALTLVQLAGDEPDKARRAEFYRQALTGFEAATQAEVEGKRARNYHQWAVALTELGRLANDKMLVRQAVERLAIAQQLAPTDPAIVYTLTQAHTLLGQMGVALIDFRSCLELDPTGAFRRRASTDPSLDALRSLAEFRQLLGLPTVNTPASTQLPLPIFSDR